MNLSSRDGFQKFYLRYTVKSRLWAIVLACGYALGLGAFTLFIAQNTPAPWWTLIPPIAIIPMGIVLFFRRDTYYYIDSEAYILMAGNDYGRKPHPVAYLTSLLEVRYLPHTREVKIAKGDGTEYIKMVDGERFVADLEELFTRIYPTDEEKDKDCN